MYRYLRFITFTFSLFIMPMAMQAAPSKGSGKLYFYEELGGKLFIFVAILTIILAFISLLRLFHMIIKLRELKIYQEQGLEAFITEKELNAESWWTAFKRRLTDVVPVEKEAEIMTDHDYDGIKELDNNLPPWWLWMFYASTAFAALYLFYFHFREDSIGLREEYAIEMEQSQRMVEAYLARQANLIDENNIVALTEETDLAEGQLIFNGNCAACHLESGAGSVGPNLTDPYWLHGGSIKDIFKTIKYGVPLKGMIAWKNQLRPSDIHKVSSYILTLKGTNPENPKEPQGDLYEEAEAPATDTIPAVIGARMNKEE